MSALLWINLLVTLFFVLITAAGLALLLHQAGYDVQREMPAAEAVVDYLHEAALRDPLSVQQGLTDSLRHVRVQWLAPGQKVLDSEGDSLDRRLGMHLFSARKPPLLVQLDDGRRPLAGTRSCFLHECSGVHGFDLGGIRMRR